MDRASTTMDAGGEIRCKDNFIVQTYESPSPNSLGFSSFLCVLCVKFLTSPPGKSFNTEDTEKRGEHEEVRDHLLPEDDLQTAAPIFRQGYPRDFDFRR